MTHASPATADATRDRKTGRGAALHFGSQTNASSSTCRDPSTAAKARARVVFPEPVVPTTETRFTERDDILGHTPVKLHEYQAKQLLARAGIPIPEGRLATTHEEAEAAAGALGGTGVGEGGGARAGAWAGGGRPPPPPAPPCPGRRRCTRAVAGRPAASRSRRRQPRRAST